MSLARLSSIDLFLQALFHRPFENAIMRWVTRVAILVWIAISIALLLVTKHYQNLWDQYNTFAYVRSSMKKFFTHGKSEDQVAVHGKPGDKIIVMAKMEKENTDWVTANLPEYVPLLLSLNR